VNFPTYHIANEHNKNDTHLTESINADLRHYIAGLARKSRTFFRKQETKYAVIAVFVDAYNQYGEAKQKYRIPTVHKSEEHSKHLTNTVIYRLASWISYNPLKCPQLLNCWVLTNFFKML
jgi:hypothetical protein